MHTDTDTAYAALPFAVVAYAKGDSSRVMLLGRYETAEVAHARAGRIRPTTDLVVAPVTAAYVNARTVVAAL